MFPGCPGATTAIAASAIEGMNMTDRARSFEHTFLHNGRRVRLICSFDFATRDRQLVLDDVLASTQRIADGVPDWLIEAEASNAAYDRQATCM